jgi:hypothetical protein
MKQLSRSMQGRKLIERDAWHDLAVHRSDDSNPEAKKHAEDGALLPSICRVVGSVNINA